MVRFRHRFSASLRGFHHRVHKKVVIFRWLNEQHMPSANFPCLGHLQITLRTNASLARFLPKRIPLTSTNLSLSYVIVQYVLRLRQHKTVPVSIWFLMPPCLCLLDTCTGFYSIWVEWDFDQWTSQRCLGIVSPIGASSHARWTPDPQSILSFTVNERNRERTLLVIAPISLVPISSSAVRNERINLIKETPTDSSLSVHQRKTRVMLLPQNSYFFVPPSAAFKWRTMTF
jgi:hypothetical protein